MTLREPGRAAAGLAAAVVLGVLTAFGQEHLPAELHSVANSAASWSLVAFAVAAYAVAPGRSSARSWAASAAVAMVRSAPACGGRDGGGEPARRDHHRRLDVAGLLGSPSRRGGRPADAGQLAAAKAFRPSAGLPPRRRWSWHSLSGRSIESTCWVSCDGHRDCRRRTHGREIAESRAGDHPSST